MSGQAVIGALRVVLSADDDGFDDTLDTATGKVNTFEKAVSQMADRLRDAGAKIAKVGAGLSAALTLPLGALATSAVRTAGQFEAAMKRVESALDNVSPAQLQALEKQARTMGPALGYGATQAAGAIEDLAKNGLDTANILGGGLAASMKLAASAGIDDLAPAADLTTDIMQQFGKKAAELGPVVDKVSGALLASKFGFQDYQLAVGQAGGVAGSVGVTFEDFNTALAGTSALFQSGSDAGTSFKTFLTNLTGNSKQAKKEMSDLGMSFFDSNHQMKSMADVAGVLQKALGGLSEEARNKVLTDVFGTDGMRTAIGLMKLGKDGFLDLQKTIAGASADKQVGKMQEGYVAAMHRLAAAFENLKISIGKSGLLDIVTGFVNGITRLVNGLANLSPMIMKFGAAFSVLGAALGPVLVVLGGALWFAIGFFLRTLGPLGWALSALVEPIGTLVAGLIRLVAAAGSMAVLRGIGAMFVDLLGPVGLVIGAFMIFKDSIIPVLQQLWQTAQETLGPPLEALLAKIGGIFSSVANGPISTAIGVIIDVLGTLIALVVDRLGAAFIQGAGIIIGVPNTLASLVQDVVTVITDLLQGDFGGAWAAAEQFVSDAVQGIVNIVEGLFPSAAGAIQSFYEGAKMVLGTAFGAVVEFFGGMVEWAVNAVTNAFPRAVQAAKDLYTGIKTWLVDALGPVWTWVQGFANAIGFMWAGLKESLGLGGSSTPTPAPPPPAPAAPPKPKQAVTNNYMPTDADGKKKQKKGERHGETPDDLKVQAEIEAARLRGDKETEQALQDQLDLNKRIESYQRAGLSLTNARAAAERDMKEIVAARAEANAREINDNERGVQIEVAKLDGNKQLEESLQRQADIEQRINFYRAHDLSLVEATTRAQAQQLQIDEARARARARDAQLDADQRAVDLAQLRGDSDERVRQAQRVLDVEKRTQELISTQNMDPAAARARANQEADQKEQARQQGVWRDTIKGGFRAAMDGDLKSYFSNWIKDQAMKGLEDALNNLADTLMNLFKQAMGGAAGGLGGSGGAGGIFGSLLGGISKIFGGGGGNWSSAIGDSIGGSIPSSMAVSSIDLSGAGLPAFATGGSFKVGGMAGIDTNVVSFRATKGEMVNITKGGNDNGAMAGPIPIHIIPSEYFDARVDERAHGVVDVRTPGITAGAVGAQQDLTARRVINARSSSHR